MSSSRSRCLPSSLSLRPGRTCELDGSAVAGWGSVPVDFEFEGLGGLPDDGSGDDETGEALPGVHVVEISPCCAPELILKK